MTIPQWMIDMWKKEQCDSCRRGDRKKCGTVENAVCYRQEPNGIRRYYCFVGCMMLDLIENGTEEDVRGLVESQFNVEGHYEKMLNP